MRRATALALAVLLAACGGSVADPAEWTETEMSFDLGGSTAEPVPVDRVLPDGRYWATVHEVLGSDGIVFDVTRAYFGTACEEWAAERGMEEGCTNDYAADAVTRQMLQVDSADRVTVADPAGPGRSYVVSLRTLTGLARHEQVRVPSGYGWADFPFVITVEDGRTVAVDQFWVP